MSPTRYSIASPPIPGIVETTSWITYEETSNSVFLELEVSFIMCQ